MKITIEWNDGESAGANITVDGKTTRMRQVRGGYELGPPDGESEHTLGAHIISELLNVLPELVQGHAIVSEERGEPVSAWEALTEYEYDGLAL